MRIERMVSSAGMKTPSHEKVHTPLTQGTILLSFYFHSQWHNSHTYITCLSSSSSQSHHQHHLEKCHPHQHWDNSHGMIIIKRETSGFIGTHMFFPLGISCNQSLSWVLPPTNLTCELSSVPLCWLWRISSRQQLKYKRRKERRLWRWCWQTKMANVDWDKEADKWALRDGMKNKNMHLSYLTGMNSWAPRVHMQYPWRWCCLFHSVSIHDMGGEDERMTS